MITSLLNMQSAGCSKKVSICDFFLQLSSGRVSMTTESSKTAQQNCIINEFLYLAECILLRAVWG